MDDTEAIKATLLKKRHQDKSPIKIKDMVSCGSTLVNIATSGRIRGCFVKGKYYRFVGDSNSGKTWLCMTTLAEAANNKNFDGYDLVYNNAEDGVLMNVTRYFGAKLAKRLELTSCELVEEFYADLSTRFKDERPFIYIMDSMDVLRSVSDDKKFKENNAKREKGKEEKGSYGDGKAKHNSTHLRRVISKLKETGSILIIISQTRDNINAVGHADKKTSSGGKSLKFYASLEMWTSVSGHLKKKVKDRDREQGVLAQVRIKKNRITGRDRAVTIPIYHSYGIDDVGSCVDYLLLEGHWKKKKGVVLAKELKLQLYREDLIKKIEEEGLEFELQSLVAKVWNEIEEACSIERKPRYE